MRSLQWESRKHDWAKLSWLIFQLARDPQEKTPKNFVDLYRGT